MPAQSVNRFCCCLAERGAAISCEEDIIPDAWFSFSTVAVNRSFDVMDEEDDDASMPGRIPWDDICLLVKALFDACCAVVV